MARVPAWADPKKTAAIYREARRLTIETGFLHVVDHIVPLGGKTVCGLHWHGNLQVLRATINGTKGAYWWPDMPTDQLPLRFEDA